MEINLNTPPPNHDHFKGKDALAHVIEAHREGVLDQVELHGLEISGKRSAFGTLAASG